MKKEAQTRQEAKNFWSAAEGNGNQKPAMKTTKKFRSVFEEQNNYQTPAKTKDVNDKSLTYRTACQLRLNSE